MSTKLTVMQNSYGEWVWSISSAGEVLIQGSPAEDRDDAVAEAVEVATDAGYVEGSYRLVIDGYTSRDAAVSAPPKVDAVLEAARAGVPTSTTPTEDTPEAQAVREELRLKMEAAEKRVAKAPDELMEEPKPKPVRGRKVEQPTEEFNPIAHQRQRVENA
jgi:hypothetical protein